jgi:hypothetical protein
MMNLTEERQGLRELIDLVKEWLMANANAREAIIKGSISLVERAELRIKEIDTITGQDPDNS